MLLNDLIRESRPGRKLIDYYLHGTSDLYLPSIKRQGLQPWTGNKGFGSESPAWESYGGIYLTKSKTVAKHAALDTCERVGGNPIIFSVQVVLGSGGYDEDHVNAIIAKVYNLHNRSIVDFVDAITDSWLGSSLPVQNHNIFHELYKFLYPIAGNNFKKTEMTILSDPNYRKIINTIISKMKQYGQKDQYNPDHRDQSIRITRPIGFRGKTRILNYEYLKK